MVKDGKKEDQSDTDCEDQDLKDDEADAGTGFDTSGLPKSQPEEDPIEIFIVTVNTTPPLGIGAVKGAPSTSIASTRPRIKINLNHRNGIVYNGMFGVLYEHRRLVEAFTKPGEPVYGIIDENATLDNGKSYNIILSSHHSPSLNTKVAALKSSLTPQTS